jgi:DNA repair exonuclease SbcCD ATPase subunit
MLEEQKLESKKKEIMIRNESLTKEIGRIENSIKRLNELKDKEKEIQKKLNLQKSAREFFHRDKGLAKYLRETSLVLLNRHMIRYFSQFNQNPKYLSVTFNKDYEPTVKTVDGDMNAMQLSGGEIGQLALALRLALIDLLSPTRLMILDEPFGSLDTSHRELLADTLNKVSRQGQLIIVTHIPVDNLQLENKLDLGGY